MRILAFGSCHARFALTAHKAESDIAEIEMIRNTNIQKREIHTDVPPSKTLSTNLNNCD